jgi:hypothetical protein
MHEIITRENSTNLQRCRKGLQKSGKIVIIEKIRINAFDGKILLCNYLIPNHIGWGVLVCFPIYLMQFVKCIFSSQPLFAILVIGASWGALMEVHQNLHN